MELTHQNVVGVMKDCLYEDEEAAKFTQEELLQNSIIVRGVMLNAGLRPDKVEAHKEDILSLLGQLPEEFMQHKGGGSSFLRACMNKEGEQWGEHRVVDTLLCLGLAINRIEFSLPREAWQFLPAGLPYFTVLL